MNRTREKFTLPLLKWYETQGRHDLPWQHPRDAYHVWISEIMLQQTQVKTVIPYFTRFINHFPDIHALAVAHEDDVLALWSGLGYYSRARNLHKTAMIIHSDFQGEFPRDTQQLITLPGIGPSTAAAIASLAFGQPTAILDANVKRVLSRYFLVGGSLDMAFTNQTLWQWANECMPKTQCADYTQAIMDMGATCCTTKKPHCVACPLQGGCLAFNHGEVDNYPQKKQKITRPVKQQQFLLLHTHHPFIYLERRPPTGIWGGLWCLPSIDENVCPLTHMRETYEITTDKPKKLMDIKHSFSHFHLHISAKSLLISNGIPELPGRWFRAGELTSIGLPKPVSAITQVFLEHI